ncbi:hypothetical protein [Limnoglobus roseus]|uniref:Uncharacterized protein n=1 Tax=Limnoglobus roseus TaxID=2598579 RepID=A0A5C1A750_9BACT|nr:hypothetical protein [Limnoglobus roseus]QEL15089.1 hypothetical protein PX52LOC_01997 [Limnoglobus roseus]
MATIELGRYELEDLPPVCVQCGAAATEVKVERFTWTPQWAQFTVFLGLLPWFIFVALTQQKATVHLPMCDEHFRRRPLIGQLVWVGVAIGAALIGVGLCIDENLNLPSSMYLSMAGFATLVVTLLVVLFGSDGSVRATHITRSTITLDRVSEEFVDAVQHGFEPSEVAQELADTPPNGMELQTAKYLRRR